MAALGAQDIPFRENLLKALRRASPLPFSETAVPGAPTLSLNTPAGVTIVLHSTRDPVREAEKWVTSQLGPHHTHALFAGFALGYACEAALRMFPALKITAVEANIPVLTTAMHCRDISHVLSDPRFTLIAGTFAKIKQPLMWHIDAEADDAAETCVLVHKPSIKALPPRENALAEAFSFIQNVKKSASGVHAEAVARNEAKNEALADGALTLAEIAGQFAGRAAVFVAPGPSLRKNISQLKQYKGRAVIVAADAALAPLLHAGVRPDYTVTTDPTPAVARFFSPSSPQDTTLVFIPASNPDVVAMFPHDKRVACGITKDAAANAPGELFVAGSVSLSALDFCVKLGCSPVICAGLDFAVSGAGTHIPGSPARAPFNVKRELIDCDGYLGPPVKSIDNLLIYLRATEEYVAARPGTSFIDATEGGALIRGMSVAPLVDALPRPAGSGSGGVAMPCSAAVLPNGNMAVTDGLGRAVHFFAPDGTPRGVSGGMARPMGICAAPDGGGYLVVDSWAHCVFRFTAQGEVRGQFGGPGSAPGALMEPWGVCVFNGNIIVSEREAGGLSVFSADGEFLFRRRAFFMNNEYAPPLTALAVCGEYLIALHAGGKALVLDEDFNCEDVIECAADGFTPWWIYPAGGSAFVATSIEGGLKPLRFAESATQPEEPPVRRIAAVTDFASDAFEIREISAEDAQPALRLAGDDARYLYSGITPAAMPKSSPNIISPAEILPIETDAFQRKMPLSAMMLDDWDFLVVFHPYGGSLRVSPAGCFPVSAAEPDSVIHTYPDGTGNFMGISQSKQSYRITRDGKVLKQYGRCGKQDLTVGLWGAAPKPAWGGMYLLPNHELQELECFDADGMRLHHVRLPDRVQPIDTALISGGERLAVLAVDGYIYLLDPEFRLIEKISPPAFPSFTPAYLVDGGGDALFITYYIDDIPVGYPTLIASLSTDSWELNYAAHWYSEPEGVRRFIFCSPPIPCGNGSFWILDRNNWRLLKFTPGPAAI